MSSNNTDINVNGNGNIKKKRGRKKLNISDEERKKRTREIKNRWYRRNSKTVLKQKKEEYQWKRLVNILPVNII